MVADIAGIKIKKKHIKGPEGVRGRNSDNTKLKKVLNWAPKISLEEGMKQTYAWVEEQVKNKYSSK
jgi:nucleoside-diphosphate-sugar epimerase